jgi:sulfate adenylyltransferase subunit 1 (EFTu-like GTPase family)
LPSGKTTIIEEVETMDGPLEAAYAPMGVTIRLEDDIDVSRGDMIVSGDCSPEVTQDIDLMVCWLDEKPLQVGGRYAVKHTSRDARCVVKAVHYKVDMNTLDKLEDAQMVGLNDIARISIKTTVPLCADHYKRNRETGSLILIDEATNVTVAAGMIE